MIIRADYLEIYLLYFLYLKGLKVACYYGCLITRPARVTGAENPEYPQKMDRLVKTLGAETSAAFNELKGISRHISGKSSHARLTISAPLSIVSGWLSQQISEFLATHGPIDISLRSDNDPVDFDQDAIDIRMSYGRFHYRTHDTNEIVTDAIFPVCAPSFMEQNGPSTSAENLLDVSLIHTDWGPASVSFPTWRNWFDAASVSPGRRTDHGLVANSSMVAINLAVNGLGVTLCQGLLAARLIEEGALVHAYNLALPQSQAYCLTIPQRSVNRPIVSIFQDWLLQICRSTARSVHLGKIYVANLPQ